MVKSANRQHGDSRKKQKATEARTSKSLQTSGRVAKSTATQKALAPRKTSATARAPHPATAIVASNSSTASIHIARIIDDVATASHPRTLAQQQIEIIDDHRPARTFQALRTPPSWSHLEPSANQTDSVSTTELKHVLSSVLTANQQLMSTIVTNRTSAADNGRSYPKHVQFYGKKDEDFDLWLENFLARTKRIRLSDPAEHLELFRASLEGTARHAFDNLDAIHRSSIDLAAHKLRGVFTFTRKQQWLAHFGDAKYESEEETFQLFGVRVGRLNRKAYPELAESPHLEMLCVQSFIAGLPSDLRKVVGSQEPTTLDDAIIVAEKQDAFV